MNEEFEKMVLKNARSIAVSHLWTFYRETDSETFLRNPSLDYHLHFISFNDEYDNIGYLCLDTGDFLISDKESFGNNIHQILKQELVHSFIDNLTNFIKAKPDYKEIVTKLMLNKSPQSIWNKFNEIKNSTFFRGLEGLASYLGTEKISSSLISPNEYESKPQSYGVFKFEILEDRRLQKAT